MKKINVLPLKTGCPRGEHHPTTVKTGCPRRHRHPTTVKGGCRRRHHRQTTLKIDAPTTTTNVVAHKGCEELRTNTLQRRRCWWRRRCAGEDEVVEKTKWWRRRSGGEDEFVEKKPKFSPFLKT